MANLIDLKGKVIGHLTVIRRLKNNRFGGAVWRCQCTCKRFCNVSQAHLGKNTFSCGCLRKAVSSNKRKKEGSSFRALLNAYRQAARKRGQTWELSDEQFKEITSQRCYYCGAEPALVWTTPSDSYKHNGVDRKDSSIGYTPDNCVPCCKQCNYAKRDLSVEEFVEHAIRISDYWKKG